MKYEKIKILPLTPCYITSTRLPLHWKITDSLRTELERGVWWGAGARGLLGPPVRAR